MCASGVPRVHRRSTPARRSRSAGPGRTTERRSRSAQEHKLVARFADAFKRGEVEPIVALLAEDAWWTMPPEPYGYQGHDTIKQFIAHAFATRETPRRL